MYFFENGCFEIFTSKDVLKLNVLQPDAFCKHDVLQSGRYVNLTFWMLWNWTLWTLWNRILWNLTFCGCTILSNYIPVYFPEVQRRLESLSDKGKILLSWTVNKLKTASELWFWELGYIHDLCLGSGGQAKHTAPQQREHSTQIRS